ncbi:MAG: hypothetical protein JNL98_00745 [Bryobacterales bacterium]|nr:hypothetical protein [Bryobacterales bacterium]
MGPDAQVSRRFALATLASPFLAGTALPQTLAQPVIDTGVPAATKDKPQSKLWFAAGTWWAWLPVKSGSAIWRRTPSGWERQRQLDARLGGLPGQADVWADGDTVRTVLVEPPRIAIIALRWNAPEKSYRLDGNIVLFTAGSDVETATIDRDSMGRWCVAYNSGRRMWARLSLAPDGKAWTAPIEVTNRPASADDICSVVALPDAIGVVWSDQADDAVLLRRHSSKAGRWEDIEVVEQGGKTADDHIHIASAGDGRLFVATKNSVDRIGAPQQVLRVRSADGKWTNHTYAPLTTTAAPTRPIAQLSHDGRRLYLLHTTGLPGRRPPHSVIVAQTTATDRIQVQGPAATILEAAAPVNNVTGSKARLPKERPWIVLASDAQGRVYEAPLD